MGIVRLMSIAVLLLCSRPALALDYTYDPLNRLTSVTYDSGATVAYSYDAAGNMLSRTFVTPPDPSAPSVPVGLSASGVSATQVNLSWTAATNNVGVTAYKVYRAGVLITTTGNVVGYSDTGLTASTTYSYTVAACDAAANCSVQSAAALTSTLGATDTTAPSVPGGLSATATSASQINLAWTASTDAVGVTAYKVYRGGTLLATLGNVTSYSNTGLTASTSYSYTVAACDAAANCSAQSGAVSATTLAAPTSGSVVAWGFNGQGQTTIPAGLSGVTAIAAGWAHTVALKNDGTVVAWGDNSYGQRTIPAGLSEVTAIAAGVYYTVALKNDGTVLAWGDNSVGQTTIPAGLSGVTAIAAGHSHTVALKNDGTVVAWGTNGSSQTTIPAGLSGVTAIAAGAAHTVALKNDGTLVAWGSNGYGQTTIPAGLSGVTAIAAGYQHTVALKNDGTVLAWGWNNYGQTTIPAGLSGVTAIAAGYQHTVALKNDGTVLAWGDNSVGQTTIPAGLSGVTAIAAGGWHTVALVGTIIDTTPPVLVVGWNLLGNSVNAALDVANAFSDTNKVATVWKWLAATSKWAFYTPALADGGAAYAASKGYNFLTTINVGEGFWVNAKAVFTAQLPTGVSIVSSHFADQPTPPNRLPAGWSLIATGDNKTPSDFNKSLGVTPPAQGVIPVNITTLWAWDSAAAKWYFYAPSLDSAGTLETYISGKNYLDFGVKTLTPTTGFWVNKP